MLSFRKSWNTSFLKKKKKKIVLKVSVDSVSKLLCFALPSHRHLLGFLGLIVLSKKLKYRIQSHFCHLRAQKSLKILQTILLYQKCAYLCLHCSQKDGVLQPQPQKLTFSVWIMSPNMCCMLFCCWHNSTDKREKTAIICLHHFTLGISKTVF